jgi:hypothetical protein
MKKGIEHIIITRVGLKKPQRVYDRLNVNWEAWLKDSIKLMDTYCRASLRNQSNQNFTLLSLFDKSVTEYGNVLHNEVILKSEKENEPIKNIIRRYTEQQPCKKFIITRLDRDDCLRYDFIKNVQKYLKKQKKRTYVDITHDRHYLNVQTNEFYRMFKPRVSPFASTLEKNKGIKTSIYPFCVGGHTNINSFCTGAKYSDIVSLTIIHDNNIRNYIADGALKAECKLQDFGLKPFNVKRS